MKIPVTTEHADEPLKTVYPKCWYRPISDVRIAGLALRFTLAQNVTALPPPGDEKMFRLALDLAAHPDPLNTKESKELSAWAQTIKPIFKKRKAR